MPLPLLRKCVWFRFHLLSKIIFGNEDEWICKVAESDEDRKNLIEAGFQFVEQVEGKSYYRKRKEKNFEKTVTV